MQSPAKHRQPLVTTLFTLTLVCALVFSAPLQACSFQQSADPQTTKTNHQVPAGLSFDEFAEVLFEHEMTYDSVTFNQMIEDPAKLGIEAPEPTFGEYSLESYRDCDVFYRSYLEILATYNYDDLSISQQDTYQQIQRVLEVTLEMEDYFYYLEPLRPSNGMHAELPIILLEFNFRSRADIDYYLALLADFPRYFEQLALHEQQKQSLGLLMSSESMEAVLSETLNFTNTASEHILVIGFEAHLNSGIEPFASLTPAERDHYRQLNFDVVNASVIPAYQQLYANLEQIAGDCQPETSLASYPNGQDFYQLQMSVLGFSQTPAEAAATLDTELAEDWEVMMVSEDALYQSEVDLEAAMQAVPDDPEAIIAFIQQNYSAQFPDFGDVAYQVKVAPKETPSDFALAFYIIPPVDNPQQNIIYYYPDNISSEQDLYTTLAHEGIPGHMYQTVLFTAGKPAHIAVWLMNSAYMEGWAMYAENISLEFLDMPTQSVEVTAAYTNFLYGLQARIDIGVNYQGWGLSAVREYLERFDFGSASRYFFLTAIDQPTAYLPYGLGVVEFYQLRERAEAQLGADFDAVSFHREIILHSGAAFDVLEQRMAQWLAGQYHKTAFPLLRAA